MKFPLILLGFQCKIILKSHSTSKQNVLFSPKQFFVRQKFQAVGLGLTVSNQTLHSSRSGLSPKQQQLVFQLSNPFCWKYSFVNETLKQTFSPFFFQTGKGRWGSRKWEEVFFFPTSTSSHFSSPTLPLFLVGAGDFFLKWAFSNLI